MSLTLTREQMIASLRSQYARAMAEDRMVKIGPNQFANPKELIDKLDEFSFTNIPMPTELQVKIDGAPMFFSMSSLEK